MLNDKIFFEIANAKMNICQFPYITNFKTRRCKNDYVRSRKPYLECILKLRIANIYAGARVTVETRRKKLVPIDRI